jgi:hypothetical protein
MGPLKVIAMSSWTGRTSSARKAVEDSTPGVRQDDYQTPDSPGPEQSHTGYV